MPRQVLIRRIPDDVHKWMERERKERLMTQQEFLINVLKEASEGTQLELPCTWKPRSENLQPDTVPFTFVDLFAGIGGIRLGFERAGGRCVSSVEWDRWSQKTYQAWFGEIPLGDIRKIDPKDIPDHDVLAAGFPCQPFSIAGVSKKKSLGRAHGFRDKLQGNLFFNLATIIEIKRPPVLALENVKNLLSHDGGRTWKVIRTTLEELNYVVFHRVIDAASWVPQHRERIFIICFDRKVFGDEPPFEFPLPPETPPRLSDILEKAPDSRYTLSDHLWSYLQKYAEAHRAKGNGFGFGIANPNGITRTLSARYFKDGSEILIPQGKGKNPRRLTPREAARLMGFDDSLKLAVSDTQAYRQFGNAVVPAVAEAVGRQIVKVICWQLARSGNGCLLKNAAKETSTRIVKS